jgi:hypothetical protein
MLLPVQQHDCYPEVTAWDGLARKGSAVFRPTPYLDPAPFPIDFRVAAGTPAFRHVFQNKPVRADVVRIDGAIRLPRRVIIDSERGAVSIASYRRPSLAPAEREIDDLPLDIEFISGVTYSADSEFKGYGHLLLESLSQLWAVKNVRADRVLISDAAASYFTPLFEPFDLPPLVTFKQPVQFESLIVANQCYVLDESVTTTFVEICGNIRDHFDPDGSATRKLYISRARARQRKLENEAEVESVMVAHGFEIIHPEEISLPDQVRLFSNAAVIVGPAGSGLYNAIFSRPGTRRLILAPPQFYSRNDMLLGALTGVPPIYVFGDQEPMKRSESMTAGWRLPIQRLLDGLNAL